VQLSRSLERLNQALLSIQHIQGPMAGYVECLGLVIVVSQHQLRDLVRHGGEQVIALLEGQVTSFNHTVKQDLDVDFVVRTVDARRVIDRIGIDQAPSLGIFNPTQLSAAKVATLHQDLAAKFIAIDPERITGLVTGLLMGFA